MIRGGVDSGSNSCSCVVNNIYIYIYSSNPGDRNHGVWPSQSVFLSTHRWSQNPASQFLPTATCSFYKRDLFRRFSAHPSQRASKSQSKTYRLQFPNQFRSFYLLDWYCICKDCSSCCLVNDINTFKFSGSGSPTSVSLCVPSDANSKLTRQQYFFMKVLTLYFCANVEPR